MSAFHRITGIGPGSKAAQDWVDSREAIFEQDFRRTDARLFGGSGAVSDDPLVGIELTQARFKELQRDR